jgi:hypothetical protein
MIGQDNTVKTLDSMQKAIENYNPLSNSNKVTDLHHYSQY